MAFNTDRLPVDLSYYTLRQRQGGQSWLRDYLALEANDLQKYFFEFPDLALAAIPGELTTATSSGTGAQSFAGTGVTNQLGGWIRGITGTTDDAHERIYMRGKHFTGDAGCVIAVRAKLSAITGVKFEIGFEDDAAADAGAVNAVDTPTATAGDAACWVFDTDGTVDRLKMFGVKAAAPLIDTLSADIVVGGATATGAPVAATFNTYVVAIRDDTARFLLFDTNDKLIYASKWYANYIEGGTAITPYVFLQGRNTTSKNFDLDFVRVWGNRSTT